MIGHVTAIQARAQAVAHQAAAHVICARYAKVIVLVPVLVLDPVLVGVLVLVVALNVVLHCVIP